MGKYDLIKNISSKNVVLRIKNMQVLEKQSEAYFNFINTLHSESTRESYRFCLEKILNHYEIDLLSFLKLPQQDITNHIIKYLVDKKVSRQYKNLITATLKHACEINDIVLNWKKIKKFVHPEKIRTAFLLLTSTGIRIGALQTLKLEDLEKIDGIYKIKVYSGDKEEYITFCTGECARDRFLLGVQEETR